jgi:hypothetical protein
MSFLDKVKAGVKAGAEQAASKAQVEYERLQARRELQQTLSDFGEKAAELADRGEIHHDELTPLLERVRAAKAELDAIGKEEPAEAAAQAEPAGQPPEPAAAPEYTEEPPSA